MDKDDNIINDTNDEDDNTLEIIGVDATNTETNTNTIEITGVENNETTGVENNDYKIDC